MLSKTPQQPPAISLISSQHARLGGVNYVVKRSFDVMCASILLIGAFPVLLLAALAIWIFDGGEVLYRQKRIGAHGRPFEMLKLRTMKSQTADQVHREFVQDWIRSGQTSPNDDKPGAEPKVFKLCDDPRITTIGKVLRRFSIDELPQLWNVLRGDMSLIGPRPALPYEIELYEEWHRRRLEGLPGITGLWQVSGRNRLSFDDMVRLDVKYLDEWSLTSDIRILLHTIPVLLRGEGL
jgi:lipopolysaccharide/colanic/teichoic acid biosynthesis glycosyltransferase